MALIVGAGALFLLAKWGLPKIPNPMPAIRGAVSAGDELTGGLQKGPNESVQQYLFEYDVPFSETRVPLVPAGLRRDQGRVYTTEGQYTRMDIAEPNQSWGSFLSEIDLPGLPAYDVRDAPADLYKSTIGRVLR